MEDIQIIKENKEEDFKANLILKADSPLKINKNKTDTQDNDKEEEDEDDEDEDYATENLNNYSCLRRYFGPIKPGSLRGGIFSIASITFGGGCLSFPYAISLSGPLLGTFIFLVVASLSYITLRYLLDNGLHTNIMNYNELVEYSLGTKMRVANDIANIILCCGLLIAYQYIISILSLQVLNYFFNINCEGYPKLIQIIVAAVLLQIPLSLFKKISDLQYISIIGSMSIIITVLVIIIESPFYFIQAMNNDEPMPITPPKGIGLGFVDTIGMFLYGFSSHNGIFQTFNELNRPGKRRCHKVLNRAFTLELVIYLPLALAGFLSTFYNTPDVFLRRPDLQNFNDIIIIIVRIFLIFTMSSSIAVNYNILRMSINSMFFTEKPSTTVDAGIVVLVYILTNTITYFLKNAGTLLSFLGGLATVLICFITPISIDLVVKPELKSKQRRYFNYAFFVLIIMISLACTIKGIYDFILSNDEKPLCPDK